MPAESLAKHITIQNDRFDFLSRTYFFKSAGKKTSVIVRISWNLKEESK